MITLSARPTVCKVESTLFLYGRGASEGFLEYPLMKHAEKGTVRFQLTGLKSWLMYILDRHLGHLKTPI